MDNLITDPHAIKAAIESGTVLNAESVCPVCYARPRVRNWDGRYTTMCRECIDRWRRESKLEVLHD